MGFYKENKDEIMTLQLISQILGKIKLEYGVQEPQWAHVILDITPRGFTTGLLTCDSIHFEVQVDLVKSLILITTKDKDLQVKLEDGKSISRYYEEIINTMAEAGLKISIQTNPQEMEWKKPFQEDNTHHHYNEKAGKEILQWFQFAWDVQQSFIGPIRQRKVYPGLFWGTFDVSSIIVYNKYQAFPDDSKIIERGAFDEHMVEFGFWLGDDNFDHPTFFILPYPFVEGVELQVDDSFPEGSYFSSKMAEYLYEMKDGMSEKERDKAIQFMEASFKKSMDYLKWENTDYYFKELKMEKKQK